MSTVYLLGCNDDYRKIIEHGGSGFSYQADLVEKMYRYLSDSPPVAPFLGYESCSFGCKDPIYESYHSDGKWVWQRGLAHYVKGHLISLPGEFVYNITSNIIPKALDHETKIELERYLFNEKSSLHVSSTIWNNWVLDFSKNPRQDVYTLDYLPSPKIDPFEGLI